MGKLRLLRPLKELREDKRKIVGFDIETHGDKNRFVLGSITDGQQFLEYDKAEDMLQALCSRKFEKTHIFATNLSFDLLGLLKESKDKDIVKLNFHKGRLICGVTKKYKNKIYDTINFLPASVEKLGRITGFEKMTHPYFFPNKPKNNKEQRILQDYCNNDALVTQKFGEFLRDGFNILGCKMKYTIASSSMDLWRRKYLKKPLIQPTHEETLLQYNGYYGGRTEAFKRGLIKNYNYYDVNSLYPDVMSKAYPLPDALELDNNPSRKVLDYEGISEVIIKTNDSYYPLLPVRQDKLRFVNGIIRGWYNHVELRKALSLGYNILEIKKSYYSKKSFHPFKSYIETMYNNRLNYKKQGSSMEIMYKLAMNSLYGKFAQKIEDKESIYHESEMTKELLDNDNINRVGEWFYITRKLNKSSYGRFIIPILSSTVTSHARSKIYDLIVKSKAIYTDTDSIITKKELSVSPKIGALKKEYVIRKGLIVKPKMYILNDTDIKIKGVGRKVKDKDDFKAILDGQPVNVSRFAKFKEANRRGKEYNELITMFKKINLEDDKRKWYDKFDYETLQDSTPLHSA